MRSVFFLSLMNSAAWGGSEEIWFHSAIRLAKNGYKVGVCCFDWPGKEEKLDALKKSGCEIFLLPGRNETKNILGKLKLKRKLQQVPFTNYEKVIINQGGWKDVVHGAFKTLYKQLTDYSLLFHNYDETDHLPETKRKLFTRWVTKATKNIGAAARIFPAIKKSIDIDVPRQEVLFNPITFPQPVNETPFTLPVVNKLIFTMLAELDTKRKAQDVLVETFASDKWQNRNFELHLYGKGKDHAFLENLISQKQLSSKIFLKGFTKNVYEALTNSHVLLQITHFDAMPIAVTEALAVSRPVIVSDVGDMPLWVKDDMNGWVVSKADPIEIDTALEKAWQQRDRLEEMGKLSFRIFKEKYPANSIEFFLNLAGIGSN